MSRPAPRITPEEIIARVILDPNGGHQLEIAVPSEIVGMKFSAAQVRQLEQACARFRSITIEADGGPDFHNRKMVSIEVRR